MPRYFFDFTDHHDDTGVECADVEDARRASMQVPPAIASEHIPFGEDQQTFGIVMRDESGATTYSASLSLNGRNR